MVQIHNLQNGETLSRPGSGVCCKIHHEDDGGFYWEVCYWPRQGPDIIYARGECLDKREAWDALRRGIDDLMSGVPRDWKHLPESGEV